MEIISGTTDFKIKDECVVTIGKFDGLHKGHALILDRMKNYMSRGLKLCVLTFDVPPSALGFGSDRSVLTTNEEKEVVFNSYGVDYLVEFPFYEKTAAISAVQFIEEFIVDKMNAKAVVVGTDCTFGHKASGNAGVLRDFGPIYGYDVVVLNKLHDGDREISSTYIRELVKAGNVSKAYELSCRPYYIYGKLSRYPVGVIPGLECYTIDVSPSKQLPMTGVYFTEVYFDDVFYAAISNVTGKGQIITYLYNSVKGIEKDKICLAFMERMRDEMDYNSEDDIGEQVRRDIFEGQKWLKEHWRN